MLKLKVINIDSPIDLTQQDCAFTEQVIFLAEDLDKTEKRWNSENSLSPLLKNVPIFLLSDKSMGKNEEKGNEEPATEYFGYYTRTPIKIGKKSIKKPAVFICPERILKISLKSKSKISYQELLAKTIIHEFAHAIMDYLKKRAKAKQNNEFYKWVEEPFANWFALKYFDSYGQGPIFNRVALFVENQPANYRLGLNFFYSKISDNFWEFWRIKKIKGFKDEQMEDWLKSVQGISESKKDVSEHLEKLLKSKIVR